MHSKCARIGRRAAASGAHLLPQAVEVAHARRSVVAIGRCSPRRSGLRPCCSSLPAEVSAQRRALRPSEAPAREFEDPVADSGVRSRRGSEADGSALAHAGQGLRTASRELRSRLRDVCRSMSCASRSARTARNAVDLRRRRANAAANWRVQSTYSSRSASGGPRARHLAARSLETLGAQPPCRPALQSRQDVSQLPGQSQAHPANPGQPPADSQ